MCGQCGCEETRTVTVPVHGKILSANEQRARHNREHFAEAGVLAVNLMGSPGAGKTAILEATATRLRTRRLAALAADLATDNDAVRLQRAGIPSTPITTGTACHLDADIVHRALHGSAWRELDYLFVENVGNLVCPAVYDLGQAASVVALSVTEGEDKPLKYPVMFLAADLVLLTKLDLLPHLGVSVAAYADALARVNPKARLLPLSAKTGEGLDPWIAWLEHRREHLGPTAGTHVHRHAEAS